ncbi:MAG: M56 family metallopeptidase [Rhizomicrobium sp.]
MSGLLTLRILLLACEFLAASSAVVVLAWLAALRGSAASRHLVWTAAFGALLLLPLLAALVPGTVALKLQAPVAAVLPPPAAMSAPVTVDVSAAPLAAPAPRAFHFDLEDAVLAALALWAAGMVLIALRSAIAAFILRALRRDSVDNPFDPCELPELASGRRYELRVSNRDRGPVTWGALHPVVLLPKTALYWPGERLHAVLRHELAHVHRRDSLTQILALAMCTLYWPNPLVWLAARAMRREAEMAADDAVLVSGMAPSDYAGELLHVVAEFRAQNLSPAASLFMAAPSALEARLKSVLAPSLSRSGVTSMDVMKFSAAALLATTALVLARPSLAQDAPPAPPVVSAPADAVTPPAPPPDADAPVPPAPPVVMMDDSHGDMQGDMHADMHDMHAGMHGRHGHIHIVRRFRDKDGHMHIQTIDRDGDPAQMVIDVQPEIDRAMADVQAHHADMHVVESEQVRRQLDAVGPEVQKALAQARAELAKVSDAKIRARVDAALARAQEKIAAAQVRAARHVMRIEERDDESGAPDTPVAPVAPPAPVAPLTPDTTDTH